MMDLREQLQQTLGEAYTLERELGGGGMSRVFVSEERALGRLVVVKVLPDALSGGVNIERFKREIQVAARMQHAHIVPVLTAGETHGLPYYTMPFVDGESLRARIGRGRLPLTEAISILRDVARALAYAHDHGVVHRDIKPDNVLLSGGSAVVADFGIAKAISAARTTDGSATLTQLGTTLGTPAYMAPEQAAADPATDHRADLYAFGCMAYEMLTGAPPFVEKSPQQLLAAHMAKVPAPVTPRRPDVPQALATLVMQCLEKNANDRPASASKIVSVLETVTGGSGHAALPELPLTARGGAARVLLAWAAALIVVVVLAKAATIMIGLPDWVVPGAFAVMVLGLPVIGFTWYAQRVVRRTLIATLTYSPGGTASSPAHGRMATMAMKASPHLSWRRTTMGGVYAVIGFSVLVAAFMALRSLGIGPVGSLLASGKLSTTDQILVADFAATGQDSSLGSVLADAMRAALSKSRRVRLVPASAVTGALQRMGRPTSTRLALPVAQEMAQREGIKAVVSGEITRVGGGHIVTTKLMSASNGDVLTSFRESASGAADLIPAMDKLGRRLRSKIGESLRDVNATPPLQRVTTPSLEALRKFSEGARYNDIEGNARKAIGPLNDAIRLDSSFAMAYRKLGIVLDGTDRDQARLVLDRGFALRDRMPEAERLAFEGVYYRYGAHPDRTRQIEAYTTLFRKYPEWLTIITADLLADAYWDRRQFAVAESVWASIITTAPDELSPHADIVRVQINLSKLSEARASLARARMRRPPISYLPRIEAMLAYNEGKPDSARAILERAVRSDDGDLANARSDLVWLDVRDGLARAAARRAALISGSPPTAGFANVWASAGVRHATRLLQRPDEARRRLDAIYAARPAAARAIESPARDINDATLEAEVGRLDRARALIARFERPTMDTVTRRELEPQLHLARAWVALGEGRPRDAVREFRAADQLRDGPNGACHICADPLIGLALDRAGMRDSAIVVFEHFVQSPFNNRLPQDQLDLAWVVRRLGELYHEKGNAAKAREYYERFVEQWRNADAELQPQVASVRARLKALDDAERRRR